MIDVLNILLWTNSCTMEIPPNSLIEKNALAGFYTAWGNGSNEVKEAHLLTRSVFIAKECHIYSRSVHFGSISHSTK